MNILILGATGRTGKLILQKAIQAGHNVTAIVRNPKPFSDSNLKVIEGSPYNKEIINGAIENIDVVISTLNVSRISDNPWAKLRAPKDLISKSISNVIEAADGSKLKRIIVLSALGSGESKKKMPFFFNLFISMTNLRYAFQDHTRQENLLINSKIDWTIIRLPMLSEETGENDVIVNFNDKTKLNRNINRETVARFVLNIILDEKYYKQIVAISNK